MFNIRYTDSKVNRLDQIFKNILPVVPENAAFTFPLVFPAKID